MSTKTTRLALAGHTGSGKAILGQELSRRLGVPFIEEGLRRQLESGIVPDTLPFDERRAWLEAQWEEQEARQNAETGFVAARSSLDFAACWFRYGFDVDPDATELWMTRMCDASHGYDRILLLPWGLTLPDSDTHQDRWVEFRFQALLEGVIKRFSQRGQVLQVPGTPSVEQRAEYVMRYV